MTLLFTRIKRLSLRLSTRGKVLIALASLVLIVVATIGSIYWVHSRQNSNVVKIDENPYGGNSYLGIKLMDKNGNMLPSRNIALKSGERLDVQFQIDNGISTSESRAFILKVYNGKQFISYLLDGKKTDSYYFRLDKNTRRTMQLSFDPDSSDGLHEFAFYLIHEPDKDLSERDRNLGYITISRFNISINNSHANKEPDMDVSTLRNPNDISRFGFVITDGNIIATKEQQGIKVLTSISRADTKQLIVNIPNTTEHTTQYKLIFLKGWKTTKLLGKDFLLFSLEPNEQISIPVDLELTDQDIGSDIMFILTPNPSESMDDENLKSKADVGILFEPELSARIRINP